MRVVVLAAGKGSRLNPITNNIPKYLVDIGGLTIMDHQFSNFLALKPIKEIVLVTGYCANKIHQQMLVYKRWFKINEVYCPNYFAHNNLISLWQAKKWLNEDFAIINGDNIFDISILEALIRQKAKACLAIVKRESYIDSDMKVTHKQQKLDQVSKVLPNESAQGISIGMMRFKDEGAKRFVEILDEMATKEINQQEYYLRVVEKMAQVFPIKTLEVPNHNWTDVDDENDLIKVRNEFQQVIKTKCVEL